MEVNARRRIIDKMQSRVVNIDEFNWDHLMAPPLYSLVTQEACNEVCRIATSIRYSGNARLRMSKIDETLKPFGFERIGAGTNRLVYKFLENDTFLLKVAFDAVGVEDNPKEFRNQFIYKPFVTKIFEVDPTGAVALIERVVPINSREEFVTVASNVYDVIRGWFLGDYIMADIGTKFFMNWGIRKNFGPVLLDFPYVYELDGNKLFCNECYNGIMCGGEIDYDNGYNMLYCSKCGKRYRVKELAKATANKQIIVKGRESKMQIVAKMGNRIVKSTESDNTFKEESQAIVKKPAAPDRSGETGKLEIKASFKAAPKKENNNFRRDNNENKQHRSNNNFKNGANNRGIVRASAPVQKEEPKKKKDSNVSTGSLEELEPASKINYTDIEEEYKRKINDLKEQLESAYADYDKMEEFKDNAEKEVKDLKEKYQQALEDISKKEEEISSLKKSSVESENSSSSMVTDLNKQINDLKKQLEDANSLGQKYADDCAELEKKLAAFESEKDAAEKKLAEIENANNDNSEFAKELNDCKVQLDAEKSAVKNLEEKLSKALEASGELNTKLVDAQKQLKKKEKEAEKSNKKNIDLEAKVSDLEAKLSEAEDSKTTAVKETEAKLKAAEEKVKSFEKNLKGTEDLHKEAIDKLTAEKDALAAKNKELTDDVEDKQSTIDGLNKIIDTMTAANEASREEAKLADASKVKIPIFAKEGIDVMTKEEVKEYNDIVTKADGILPVEGVITTINALNIKNNKDFIDKDQYVMALKNITGGFVKDGSSNFICVVAIDNIAIPELFEDNAEFNKTANQVTLAKAAIETKG